MIYSGRGVVYSGVSSAPRTTPGRRVAQTPRLRSGVPAPQRRPVARPVPLVDTHAPSRRLLLTRAPLTSHLSRTAHTPWPGAARSARSARSGVACSGIAACPHMGLAMAPRACRIPWHCRLVPRGWPRVQLQRRRLCRAARQHFPGHRAGWRRAVRRGRAWAAGPAACRPACFGETSHLAWSLGGGSLATPQPSSPSEVDPQDPGPLYTPSMHPTGATAPCGALGWLGALPSSCATVG